MKINCIHVALPRFDARMRSTIAVANLQSSKLLGYYPNHYPNARVNELESKVNLLVSLIAQLAPELTISDVDISYTDELVVVITTTGGLNPITKACVLVGQTLTVTVVDAIEQEATRIIDLAAQYSITINSVNLTWNDELVVEVQATGGFGKYVIEHELNGTELNVSVSDQIGITANQVIDLAVVYPVVISDVVVTYNNGFEVEVTATGGFGELETTFMRVAENLEITVTDQIGIVATTTYDLAAESPLVIDSLTFEVVSENAVITCVASGGWGVLTYRMAGQDDNTTGIFTITEAGTYQITVFDQGATGVVDGSIEVAISLPTPTGITVIANSQTKITLSYLSDETVEVWRSTDNVNFSLIGESEASPFVNTGLTAGTIYYYKIRAIKGGLTSEFTSVVDDITHTAEYTTYVNGLTTPLSAGFATKMNKTIRLLKIATNSATLSDSFDNIWLWENPQSEASLRNVVKNAHYATNVNAVFTADLGWQGNGVDQRINLNYNPATQGVRYTRYSCSIGVYINDNANASTYHDTGNDTGGSNRNYINTRANGYLEGSANSDFLQADITGGTSAGLSIISRISQTQVLMYKNGQSVLKTATAATSLSSAAAYALSATNYSPRSQGALFYGRGFSLEELDGIDAAFDFFFYDPINDEYYVDEGPDHYPLLQAMIDNAAEGSTVTIGTDRTDLYRISQPLIFRSNKKYKQEGIVKIKKGYTIDLIADCPVGQYYVEVASPQHFTVGQWITTVDDNSEYIRELRFGWGGKIVEKIGNKIYLENANPYVPFTVERNARCGHSQGCIILENLDNVEFTGNGIIDGNRFNQIAVLPYAGLDLHGHWEHQRCAMSLVVWACHDTIVGDGLVVRNGLAHSISISAPLLAGARINERLTVRNIEASGGHDKNILVRFIDNCAFENIYTHHAGWEDGMILYSHCRNSTFNGVLTTHNPRHGFADNGAALNINNVLNNITSEFNNGNSGILIAGRNTIATNLVVKDRFVIGSNFESWDIQVSGVQITSAAGIYTTIFSVGVSKRVTVEGLVITDSKSKVGSYAIGVGATAEDCLIKDGSISNHTGLIINQANYDNATWDNFTGLVIS